MAIDPSRIFTRQQVDDLPPVTVNVKQTSTIYSQHSLQEILILSTNRNHCFSCDQTSVFSNHKLSSVLRLRTRYKGKGYTHARGLHRSSNLRASARF